MKHHIGLIRLCLIGAAVVVPLLSSGLSSRAEGAEAKYIVDTLDRIGSLRTFAWAVHVGQIEEILRGEGPFTIFAPNEEAFLRLPAETAGMVFDPGNREELEGLLAYHVASGMLTFSEMKNGTSADALNEEVLHITVKDGALFVQNARIIQADIMCSNGVVHVIDRGILTGD